VPFEGFSSPLENARGELTDESKGSILVIVVPQVLRKSGLRVCEFCAYEGKSQKAV